MAVKVYGAAMSTATVRVLLCLEEMGAEYELVPIDFFTGEHKSPPHLARNVKSRAISRYVLRKYKSSGPDLLRDGSLEESAMVDVWLEVEAQQYDKAISAIYIETVIKPVFFGGVTDEKVVAESVEKLGKVLDVYEARLSKSKYLAGDFLSFADLSHIPYTQHIIASPHASLFESRLHVKAWWESLASRPAYKKVTAGVPTSK
ncbi:hypothetical protein GW17_00031794 [Ensete ventricosum]|nr:hypothetical protein GW17_00031794 [Ensete ventricosum]